MRSGVTGRYRERPARSVDPLGAGGFNDVLSMSLRVKQLEEELREVQSSICCGLSQLLDLKDLSTGEHSTRLGELSVRVAVELGMDDRHQRSVEMGCVLHDIGKIGIPDDILRKGGPLDDDQWLQMRKHPEFSWAILRLFPGLEEVSLFALHHHERYDGTGYPGGLRGEQIPLGARIVAVVDAFDAMVSRRCYKAGLPIEEAMRRLQADSGTQFDPEIVDPFLKLIEAEYPTTISAG